MPEVNTRLFKSGLPAKCRLPARFSPSDVRYVQVGAVGERGSEHSQLALQNATIIADFLKFMEIGLTDHWIQLVFTLGFLRRKQYRVHKQRMTYKTEIASSILTITATRSGDSPEVTHV